MAQLVTGIVGGVVGFFLGGPYGAAIGFSVGSSVGALFSNTGTTVAGNTLGDIATQTSKEGVARPIIWGRVRPIAGNLIACSDPKIVKEKHKSGGKGGGSSTTTTTESVYRTYAIRVCEGPITRFVRVWRNNELVYDNRPVIEGETVATTATTPTGGMSFSAISQWGEDNNDEFLKNGRLYLGNWDQMPDSALEGIWGAGNVPAHRGTAYMVMDNELLNDTGGAVPQWIFEVERMEGYPLTSTPYAVEVVEGAASKSITNVRAAPVLYPDDFTKSSGVALVSAMMRDTSKQALTPNENTSQSLGTTLIDARLYATRILYSDTTQSATSSGVALTSASMQDKSITYDNEAVKSTKSNGVSLISGSLT